MKKFLLGFAAIATFSLAVFAASPTYVTKSGAGNAAAGASVIFPSDPSTQIRVINANWNSDSNTAVLSFSSGISAFSIAATNAATTSTTNQISGTNGLSGTSVLVVEHLGTAYAATMSSYSSNATLGAFVVVGSGGFGVATSVGDSLYQMGTATTVPVGATTNFMSGEALYVGTYQGRPVRVVLTPALVTNILNSVTAHYD